MPTLDGLISGPGDEQADDFRGRWRSKSSDDLQLLRFRDACKLRLSPRRTEEDAGNEDKKEENDKQQNDNELDNSANKKADQDLEFKGEIVISKLGEVSYLGKFLFNLPEQLEEKPLQLILETTNSLNEQMIGGNLNGGHLSDGNATASFSQDLGHEPTDDAG